MSVLARASSYVIQCAHVCRFVVRLINGRGGDIRGVRVIVLNKQHQILLVRHTYAPFIWMLPGGGIEKGESSLHAAVREVYEECGIEIHTLIPRSVKKGKLGKFDTTEYFCANSKTDTLSENKNLEIFESAWFETTHLPENIDPIHRMEILFSVDNGTQGDDALSIL